MKKLMLLFFAVAILLSACFDWPGNLGAQDKIENAEDNDIISLRGYDDEAGEYTVTAKNLTLKNANMPETTIVVGEEIEDANFTLEDCVFKALVVKGKNVRIVLANGVTITDLKVEADCTLDADDNQKNAVVSIYISTSVTEFKIGTDDTESSDKGIAIAITTIKFGAAGAGVSDGFKIVVNDPKIVEETKFSPDMNDKVVTTKGDTVEIKTEDGSSAEEDDPAEKDPIEDDSTEKDPDEDDDLDTDGYAKLPLMLQSTRLHFPADSGTWNDNVTVEPREDGEVFLIKNENPASEDICSIGTVIHMPYPGKKGKSYSIKFDLKADTDCCVNIAVENRISNFSNPSIWCNLSKEWKSFELHTGVLYEDWTEYTTLQSAPHQVNGFI